MAAPRKFAAEPRERVVRMYHDHLADGGGTKLLARRNVGQILGVKPDSLRGDSGLPGVFPVGPAHCPARPSQFLGFERPSTCASRSQTRLVSSLA